MIKIEPNDLKVVNGSMKIVFILLILSLNFTSFSQKQILFLGNTSSICFQSDSIEIIKSATLPDSISNFNSIFVFSTAESIFSISDINRLKNYIEKGGGFYCGSENWPLQAESRQITMAFYSKESWGNFDQKNGIISTEKTNNDLFVNTENFPAGKTTVAFPMDYRLKVEVWVNDEPLIQSGKIGMGKIVIDGGYSRFYCESMDSEKLEIFESILKFLE